MASQLENRIEKLEQATGSPRVVLLFDGDPDPVAVPAGATVVRVVFGPEDRHDQTQD